MGFALTNILFNVLGVMSQSYFDQRKRCLLHLAKRKRAKQVVVLKKRFKRHTIVMTKRRVDAFELYKK